MTEDVLVQLQKAMGYGFVQRALLAGCLIGVSCALLGIFLVLRRFSLIGDGIAHVAFAAVALALFLRTEPLMLALPVVALASLAILELGERARLFGDTAIGLVASFAVALGVLLASLGHGFNVDLFSYLFGSILTVTGTEVQMAAGLCVLVIVLVGLFYHDLFAATFDADHAQASGVRVRRVNRVLVLLTAVTVVLGIRLVGTMLVSSLIILPAATALQCVRGFRSAMILAVAVAVTAVVAGVAVSYMLDLPTGAMVVLINFAFFTGGLLWNFLRRS